MPRPTAEANSPGTPTLTSGKLVDHEKFTGRWKNFELGVRGLAEFSQHIGKLEDNLDNISRLESDLRAKTGEVLHYKAGWQQMLDAFADRDRIWKEKESKLAGDVEDANYKVKMLESQLAALKENSISTKLSEQKIKDIQSENSQKTTEMIKKKAAEVQSLQKAMNANDKKLKRLEGELSTKSTLFVGSEEQLRACRKELEEAKNETGLEELNADFVSHLKDLSMRFRELSKRCFFTILPKEVDTDDLFIKLQRSRLMNAISKPIPISNTVPSKHLRMAAAESIIARELSEKVFQPLNILEITAKDDLGSTLDRLFNKSPRQESILRSLLLAAYASDGPIQETRIINDVTDSVGNILAPLLFSQTLDKEFKAGFKTLLRDSLALWSQAQKSPDRILATTEGRHWDWGFHEEDEDAVLLTPEQTALISSSEEPRMTLFPRVCSYGISTPLHSGYMLWSDQGVVVAGDLESKDQVNRVNSRNGMMTSVGGKRRSSINNPTGNPLVHPPMNGVSASTRTLKAANGPREGNGQPTRSLQGQNDVL